MRNCVERGWTFSAVENIVEKVSSNFAGVHSIKRPAGKIPNMLVNKNGAGAEEYGRRTHKVGGENFTSVDLRSMQVSLCYGAARRLAFERSSIFL